MEPTIIKKNRDIKIPIDPSKIISSSNPKQDIKQTIVKQLIGKDTKDGFIEKISNIQMSDTEELLLDIIESRYSTGLFFNTIAEIKYSKLGEFDTLYECHIEESKDILFIYHYGKYTISLIYEKMFHFINITINPKDACSIVNGHCAGSISIYPHMVRPLTFIESDTYADIPNSFIVNKSSLDDRKRYIKANPLKRIIGLTSLSESNDVEKFISNPFSVLLKSKSFEEIQAIDILRSIQGFKRTISAKNIYITKELAGIGKYFENKLNIDVIDQGDITESTLTFIDQETLREKPQLLIGGVVVQCKINNNNSEIEEIENINKILQLIYSKHKQMLIVIPNLLDISGENNIYIYSMSNRSKIKKINYADAAGLKDFAEDIYMNYKKHMFSIINERNSMKTIIPDSVDMEMVENIINKQDFTLTDIDDKFQPQDEIVKLYLKVQNDIAQQYIVKPFF